MYRRQHDVSKKVMLLWRLIWLIDWCLTPILAIFCFEDDSRLFGCDESIQLSKIRVFDCWERQEDVDLHYILTSEKKQIIYVAVKRRQYQVPNQCQYTTKGLIRDCSLSCLINKSIPISIINAQYISTDLICMAIKENMFNLWVYLCLL